MTAEVLDMIEGLKNSGTDFVLVTHAMNFARRVADEVAFIGDGIVLSHGPAESVFENSKNSRVAEFFSKYYDEHSPIKSRKKHPVDIENLSDISFGKQILLAAMVADSVAMPVHWYYNQSAIERDFGILDCYHSPKNSSR